MPGFNKADYTAAYNKSNYHSYTIRFNINSESDIIRRITEEGGAKEYITRLIRQDIKARKRKDPLQITGRSSSGDAHDNIREYPVEVLEMKQKGERHVAYCRDRDSAVVETLRYCYDQGTPEGAIIIAVRDVVRRDMNYIKKGTVYAKK